MAFNPLDFFQAGSEVGKARRSPFSYGASSLMDQFNQERQAKLQYGLQSGLQENAQKLETQYEPERKKKELETEYGLKRQFTSNLLGQLGIGSGDASASPDASKPAQTGGLDSKKNPIQSAAKGSYMVKSLNPMTGDLQLGNTAYDAAQKKAEMGPQVQQDQLKNSATEANGAALMLQKLDELRNLHDKSLTPSHGINRAQVSNALPFGLATRFGQTFQAGQLKSQGPNNPDWENYNKALYNFSVSADRGLFGEKGKLIAEQLREGKKLFPTSMGTKEGDQGLWKILYSVPQKSIDYHNSLVDQYGGDPSLKVNSNSAYQKADALREEAEYAIKVKGAVGKKVAERFKAMTGMDL